MIEIPKTKEALLRVLHKIFDFMEQEEPLFKAESYKKREIECYFPSGYGKHTTAMFCVLGSPNKMHGYITGSMSVAYNDHVKGVLWLKSVHTSCGRFYLTSDDVVICRRSVDHVDDIKLPAHRLRELLSTHTQ